MELSEREWPAAGLLLSTAVAGAAALFFGRTARRERDASRLLADEVSRLRSEGLKERSDERFRLVVESSGSMVYDYDIASGAAYRSNALDAVLQYEGIEPSAEWWFSVIHPDDLERVQGILFPVVRDGIGSRWSMEYRVRRGDGSYATVSERGTITRDAEGKPARCIGTITDVSERAELASQLRQAQKMEAVGQLAGGIAHDFNNLLTAINCNVELLLDAIDPSDARRDDVIQIHEAATRAATLTRQLLAFSRRQVLQPKPLDLNETVGNMERMLRRVISGDVRLVTQLEPELDPVFADAGQMEQVVMNLVLNARDAMPAGGNVVVTTTNQTLDGALVHGFGVVPPGRYVTLGVLDAGSGMTPEVMERLFEPFFTTKGQGKGTGLGLATVHGIVIQSGAHIVVRSIIGEGTEFTVYLPAHSGEPPPRRQTPSGGMPLAASAVRTVLVVDDDDPVREVAVRALSRAGYRVIAAADGEAALSLISKQDEPDALLMLTDVLMPEMNGPQLAERVAERFPSVRIAFMSGFSADELARNGMGLTARMLLNKPFTLPDLVGFVEQAFVDEEESVDA
ncbi:MAG TPA: response regulator [Gemmatimonadaceae bacterium]|jgi:PAS domain S-box-containing protein|nr:response regulator [Gemmatimonadaceae bacterium]